MSFLKYKSLDTTLCLIMLCILGLLLSTSVAAQQINQESVSSSQRLSGNTRDDIRGYADGLVAVIDGATAISDTDLDRLSSVYGVSWWGVVGNLMVAEKIANQTLNRNYQGAVSTFSSYTAKEVLLSHQVLRELSGAAAIGQLAGLPIKIQLSKFAKKLNRNAIECQRQLYFAARSEPVNLSHEQIIDKSTAVKRGVIIGYGLGGYLSHVEFHKCSELGPLSPLSNYNKIDVYGVFRMLYDTKLQAEQFKDTKIAVAKDLLNSLSSDQLQNNRTIPSDNALTPNINITESVINPGQDFVVSINNLPGNKKDWITLAKRGSHANTYDIWTHTNGVTAGEWTFKAPTVEGEYEIRIYYNWPKGRYDIMASKVFEVKGTSIPCSTGSNVHIELSPTKYSPGDLISVRYKQLPANKKNWITMVPSSYSAEKYGKWKYTNGEVNGVWSLKAPKMEGEYHIRLYYDWPRGGYEVQSCSSFKVNTVIQ